MGPDSPRSASSAEREKSIFGSGIAAFLVLRLLSCSVLSPEATVADFFHHGAAGLMPAIALDAIDGGVSRHSPVVY